MVACGRLSHAGTNRVQDRVKEDITHRPLLSIHSDSFIHPFLSAISRILSNFRADQVQAIPILRMRIGSGRTLFLGCQDEWEERFRHHSGSIIRKFYTIGKLFILV
jgi:hypothetical protein